MFSALLGSGATHRQPKSSSQVSAAWAGWQQSGLCPPHPRASSQVPAAQPSRGVLCSPGTAGSQVIARTLQKSLESMKLCSVAPAVASSHPQSLQASSSEGSSAFAPSRQGTAIRHLCHTTSSTWQGRTGKPFNPDLSPHPLPACCFSLVFIKYLPPFAFEHHFHYPCTDPTIKNVNMA